MVQERDGLGDSCVPDFLIRVQQGGFYGWPYSYIGQHPQPGFAQLGRKGQGHDHARPAVRAAFLGAGPRVLHRRAISGRVSGSAFVALKGSWNRSEPTGYKVVRVPFKDGKPEGSYENFMTGFWVSG